MEAVKLSKTKDMDRSIWRELRRLGIGGSDAAALCGLNPYATPFQVYADKKGLATEIEDNEAMRVGRDLEEYVASRFTEATGKKVRRCNYILQSVSHPCMIANVDRMVLAERAGLECKTTSLWNKSDFENGDVPPTYYVQCQHYMAVTGFDKWYLAVLVLGSGFHWYEVTRNQSDIDALIKLEEEFWSRHVEKDEAPPVDGSSAAVLNRMHPIGIAETKALEGMEPVAKSLIELMGKQKELDTQIEALKNQIKVSMGDAEFGSLPGFSASWKNVLRKTLDTAKLKQEHPEIYEQYARESVTRRFTLKEAK